MSDPKLNALIFCKKAVFTEPWWNLVGVVDELHSHAGALEELDAFVRLGDVAANRDFELRILLVDPNTQEVVTEQVALAHGDTEGQASRALSLRCTFDHEGVYECHILYDAQLVDVQKLSVVLL